MATKYYLDWKEVKDDWSVTPYIWIDVAILIGETVGEILGGDYTLTLDELDPMDSLRKKLEQASIDTKKIESVLEVIVEVKGQQKKFTKGNNSETKVTIKDIQKVLNKYGNSNIKVKAEIKK